MVEKSLISLYKAVKEGQKLLTGSKVILPFGDEAEIYGFIATEDNLLSNAIDMPPLGECMVLSNRIIFYLDKSLHRFPIFKSVSKAYEKRHELYLLYIPRFIHSSSEYDRIYYFDSMSKETPHRRAGNLTNVKIEENIAFYYPTENDLYFESRSKLRAIGTGFAVVTRRISKPLGVIKYEIFDSHSAMVERSLAL